ncbi:hypothetical protein HX001_13470 [Empedobacter brevis]|uniref:Lipoprotein n=2 Tax=Empedobacter brevis TaxID=247 RepID=A0AAJ1QGC1_9FLAO|nr:hypothetical protein [Empedobacter brevis]MDM1073494.1 hypothetical protein [Empedobacter brevis]
MMKTIFLIIPLLVISCSTNMSNLQQDSFNDENNLIIMLRENSLDNFDSIFTIKNDTELGKTLGPINATRIPGIPIENIDFKKEILIVFNLKVQGKKNDINIVNIKNETILYEKVYTHKFDQIPDDYNLIKFYKIPYSASTFKFQEINNKFKKS